jgi:hypothetical protein
MVIIGPRRGIISFTSGSPTPVAGMAAWWNSYTGITKDGSDLVSAIADQSGNGRNLTIPIPFAGDKGLWQANQFNGKAAIHFRNETALAGQFNYLQASFTLDQPFTVYILSRIVTHDVGAMLFDGATGVTSVSQGAGANSIQIVAPTGFANATGTDGLLQIRRAVFNGASSVLQVNNLTAATGAVGANNAGGITVNCRNDIGASWANQQWMEQLVYAGVLTAGEDTQVKAYLAFVGGLTI